MYEIRLLIPSPKTLCVLYVMVNLINVKMTSIAVVVALIILFCVRINVKVRSVKWNMLNTYYMAIPRLYHVTWRCGLFINQQPWRGTGTPETDSIYASNMDIEILNWKIQSVGGFSIVLSSKLTRISTNFNHQWSLLIRNQIVQNIPVVMKYRISVTRFQRNNNESIVTCF